MKPVKKNNGKPLLYGFRNLLDDFWGADKFFEHDWLHAPHRYSPAVNIKDGEDRFDIEVAVPGMDKDDFQVEVENGILSISVEKEESGETKEDDYTRREFSYHRFRRTFSLPDHVDPDSVEAKYNNGILKLSVRKRAIEKATAKTIEIH